MPVVSVITPAWAPKADHLERAYQSLLNQTNMGTWQWEWVIQEDGGTALRDRFRHDSRVHFDGLQAHGGIANTRNLALARAKGDAVVALDHDDELTPNGLSNLTNALTQHRVMWAVGQVGDIGGDGNMTGVNPKLKPGRIEPGVLQTLFDETDGFPVYCSGGAIIDTRLLRAFGGWMAVPHSEDVGLFAVIADNYPGAYVAEPVALHRFWGENTSYQPWWTETRDVARLIVRGRVNAARELRHELDPTTLLTLSRPQNLSANNTTIDMANTSDPGGLGF